MKFFLSVALTISIFGLSAAIAQKAQVEPRSNLVEPEPFVLKAGSSFTASSPGVPVATRSRGSVAERNRILDDLREAEAVINEYYVDANNVKPNALTKSALSSMLHSLDPHSNFFDRDEWKELLDEQQSGYAGIGTSFSSFSRNGITSTFILSTFPSSAARRAGLAFGDRMIAVDGVNVVGRPVDEVREMIRGSVGTTVRLTLERAASGRSETIELRRGIVSQPSIPDHYILRPGVGYIDLSEGFNYTTYEELSTALADLHHQGMTSLVLDLRGNGGGIVDQAVKVAEKFLPSGALILSQRGRSVADSRDWSSTNALPENMPLVVVVDENTASASEIVAGALQDQDRAMIVGHKTFGKGLVQNVIDLPFKNGLTLTAARYYTPTGRSIQRDYTEIGRYDYFNHREPTAGIDRPYFEARTITNRKVLGGDGIDPDKPVAFEKMTAAQARLLDPLFLFTRELVNGRVAGVDEPQQYSVAALSAAGKIDRISISDSVITAFAASAAVGNRPIPASVIAAEGEFIRSRIRYLLATAAFGSTISKRVLNSVDTQLNAAIDTIPAAGRLSETSARIRRTGIR